ncbi:unnamed protein product [Linum tenue]|uniref:Uncharacterized protein n=1 Tax=Linum tenue TaxID=586396 RepID=A0AAV0RKG4_9ROSI|nr:unnamed protein product [Linum tenue]
MRSQLNYLDLEIECLELEMQRDRKGRLIDHKIATLHALYAEIGFPRVGVIQSNIKNLEDKIAKAKEWAEEGERNQADVDLTAEYVRSMNETLGELNRALLTAVSGRTSL